MSLAHRLAPRASTPGPAPTFPLRPAISAARAPVSEANARKRRPGTGVACLVLLGLTLGALGHVAVHLKHLEVALQLGDARKERARLEEQRRQLVLEVGVLKDPTRIMEVARERLGLGPPSAADIVPVSDLRARMVARTAGPVEKAAKPEAGSEKRQDEGAREANP